MSCWRVLQLTEQPQGRTIPQLLIKTQFHSSSYSVFLTDLSNIWSESLDLSAIVRRASDVESPIEVSESGAPQLAILFENVQKSLSGRDDASCAVSLDSSDDILLHTTISLPEPLDSLTWKFHLIKGTTATLKNELILPLLISTHVQHGQINRLLSVISDKDRAITRLVDQYESSNLDLAAAFPSIGNAKTGRRVVKREQAARYITGLQKFDPHIWKKETAETVDTDVSTLGLFEEALSECTPNVPLKLKSDDSEEGLWWKGLETSFNLSKRAAATKAKVQPKKAPVPVRPTTSDSETENEETEDEFETHENFKSRDLTKKSDPAATYEPALHEKHQDIDVDGTTSDEMNADQDDDDEDLDAPPKTTGQSQRTPPRNETIKPEPSPQRLASPVRGDLPAAKPKAKGFKIGGRPKKAESPPAASEEERSRSREQIEGIPTRSKVDHAEVDAKPAKKGFKIGGRSKTQTAANEELTVSGAPKARRDTSAATQSPSVEPSASVSMKVEKQTSPIEEAREETEEEKVERRRRELKRKNEELAKKQAQSKKKKRF